MQIRLPTPRFWWYLKNGLKVTKIYQVIEYQPKTCIKQFGDTVMNAPCQSDRDEICAIKSETMKLLDNAARARP